MSRSVCRIRATGFDFGCRGLAKTRVAHTPSSAELHSGVCCRLRRHRKPRRFNVYEVSRCELYQASSPVQPRVIFPGRKARIGLRFGLHNTCLRARTTSDENLSNSATLRLCQAWLRRSDASNHCISLGNWHSPANGQSASASLRESLKSVLHHGPAPFRWTVYRLSS